jgi:hypothetical protein
VSPVLPIISQSETLLWTNKSDERSLNAGKIQNLRVAIRRLDGIEVGADQTFSFWKQIGRASRRKGYVEGRELREGCLIPTVGGGLCQLSNALYDAALQAGFEIIERHRHTRIIPGSLAESDRDATVFWNYVDLRFRSKLPFRIEAQMTSESLVVRFRGVHKSSDVLRRVDAGPARASHISDCASCDQHSCFRKSSPGVAKEFGQTAFLVDDYWPEFDRYIQSTKTNADLLLVPIDRTSFLKQDYQWQTQGFGKVQSAHWQTFRRSLLNRRLRNQPALRRQMLLEESDRLAQHFGRLIRPTDTHLVVTQSLLPYLWRDGYLGGRTFDVLMTQVPLRLLQSRLDQAFVEHPESPTLADFRVDESLMCLEEEAIHSAVKVITPHTEIAALFPDKVQQLDWNVMNNSPRRSGKTIRPRLLFPASTLGRKGVYELREAIRELDVELVLGGPILEDKNFWQGIRTIPIASLVQPNNISAVVLPSLVENQPRRLLAAISAGVPVIASEACGISKLPGVVTTPNGNVNRLRQVLHTGTAGVPACPVKN